MFSQKDISIVIATFNRPLDIKETLSSLIKYDNIPGRIIVVDQSKNKETKKAVLSFKKALPIKYIYSDIPSSSISKNIGIQESLKEKFKFILILDDDVTLFKNYFKEALKEFNKNPKLMGLGGADTRLMHQSGKSILSSIWFKLFFLPYLEENKFRIIGPYGNTASSKVLKPITDAQWLPGFNMLYRSEVFKNYKMPESIGYNVLEDIDSSYYTFKNFGQGSLLITPKCKTLHRYSSVARYAEKKRIFVNHQDHFYFYYRYFHKKTDFIKFYWSIFGFLTGVIAKAIIKPNKNNLNSAVYNWQAILYCFKNKNRIRKGILREFLDKDLSMKV